MKNAYCARPRILIKMVSNIELKKNGTGAEYSPTKIEMMNNGNSGGVGDETNKEKYTKRDIETSEESTPLKASRDVELAAPVVSLDEDDDDHDVKDSVSLKSSKTKKGNVDKAANCAAKKFFCNLCEEKLQLTTKRSRIIGLVLFLLCSALLLAVIIMGISWPKVKQYMLEDVCLDKDCVRAASQVSNRQQYT